MCLKNQDRFEREQGSPVCEGLGEKCPNCPGPCPGKIVPEDEQASLTD